MAVWIISSQVEKRVLCTKRSKKRRHRMRQSEFQFTKTALE
ncbi:MAG: hypothetical protein ACLTXL_13545 [Clostridia bacterium]